MGSRVGSIAIFLVLVGIVAAVAVLIIELDLLNTGEPDAPVMVISIDEGELVLLNEPQSIIVTISSGHPIATLELFIDEISFVSILPAYSADRGAWIGSFVWTPERLGFADLRIVALDDRGVESSRAVRVEVTDDQARVAAALRVQVLGIAPLQQFVQCSKVPLAISATGNQPIERFDMLVDEELEISITPVADESGQYIANIVWEACRTGELEVTIVAVDAAGRSASQSTQVVIIPQGGAVPSAETESADGETAPAPSTPAEEPAESAVGTARIESPDDGQQFTLDSDLAIAVELAAQHVGAVASALLYITPVAPDGTLGASKLIHSSDRHAPGDYSEGVSGVEDWITSSGSYQLELVVFNPENERYDHQITIHVIAVAGDDGEDDAAEQDEEPPTSDAIDLAIVTARQAEDDRLRLNVSITNESTVDIEQTDLVITVIDARDGAELASAAVTLGIESDALRTIPLDLDLEPGVVVEALVLLEALVDTDTSNNQFSIILTAPAADSTDSGDEQESEPQPETEPEPQAEPEDSEPQSQTEAAASPDLSFLDVQATSDGYILMTVINNGDGAADTFFIVISDQSGQQLETVSRRDGDVEALGAGEAEILTSLQPHTGTVSITVVVGGDSVEQELANNQITFAISG